MKKLIYLACMALFFVMVISCTKVGNSRLGKPPISLKKEGVIKIKSNNDYQYTNYTLELWKDADGDSVVTCYLQANKDLDVCDTCKFMTEVTFSKDLNTNKKYMVEAFVDETNKGSPTRFQLVPINDYEFTKNIFESDAMYIWLINHTFVFSLGNIAK